MPHMQRFRNAFANEPVVVGGLVMLEILPGPWMKGWSLRLNKGFGSALSSRF